MLNPAFSRTNNFATQPEVHGWSLRLPHQVREFHPIDLLFSCLFVDFRTLFVSLLLEGSDQTDTDDLNQRQNLPDDQRNRHDRAKDPSSLVFRDDLCGDVADVRADRQSSREQTECKRIVWQNVNRHLGMVVHGVAIDYANGVRTDVVRSQIHAG